MCGIFFILQRQDNWKQHADLLRHRGPDASKYVECKSTPAAMAFHRLSINDTSDNGMQPFVHNNTMFLIANAEIYNWHLLQDDDNDDDLTSSDCGVLLPLMQKHNNNVLKVAKQLDAEIAAVFYEEQQDTVWAIRDPYGIRPLFCAYTKQGTLLAMASEAKALLNLDNAHKVTPFPPGHVFGSTTGFTKYTPNSPLSTTSLFDRDEFKTLFHSAVFKRCVMSERDVGCFLSGGLDSSLVAAVAADIMRTSERVLQTYSIGFHVDAPDLVAARKVASHIGSNHHEVIVSIEEGLQAIEEVIYTIESQDVTTVRASVPMYLLSKYIRRQADDNNDDDVVVMLSGEGADELFAGYLYFRGAPNNQALGQESERLLSDIYLFDVLRSDRCTAAWGLEVRVPFLDIKFADLSRRIDPSIRAPQQGIEKAIVRELLATAEVLPPEIANRQKDAFSDAVGYDWVKEIQRYAGGTLEDEQRLYSRLFNALFANKSALKLVPYSWLPKWCNDEKDPSACKLKYHVIKKNTA